MKKVVLILCACAVLGLTACSFHGKQPKDDAYYKRTQSVGWPD